MKTMHIVWMIALAGAPMLGASACSTTQMAGQQMDDARISGRVQRRMLMDRDVKRYDIDVDTIDGVVYLRGKVDSKTMRTSAERIARDTAGVKQVKNELKVEGAPGEQGSSDLAIRMRVGRRLSMAADVDRMNIDVDVTDGVVTLSGAVHDDKAKELAEKVTRQTKGVRDVRNELTVNPSDQLFRRDTHPEEKHEGEAAPDPSNGGSSPPSVPPTEPRKESPE